MSRTESVERGNHIFAVYPDKETELDEAFKFLKDGFDKDEVVMLITDDISKDKIRARMSKEWNVDVKALESIDYIIIKAAEEWYFPYGAPDAERIKLHWIALTEIVRVRNKKGLRVFADVSEFFKHGFVKELINYEAALEPRFDFPLTAVCAYKSHDVAKLTNEQLKLLIKHHHLTWDQ